MGSKSWGKVCELLTGIGIWTWMGDEDRRGEHAHLMAKGGSTQLYTWWE